MTVRPIIVQLRSDGKVSVVKKEDNQLQVEGGDQVIWRFSDGVDAAGFRVVLRGSDIFKGELKQTAPNEISGTVDASKLTLDSSVEYDIFKQLEWEGDRGCIKQVRPGGGGGSS